MEFGPNIAGGATAVAGTPDGELLTAARGGDQAAIGALVDRHGAAMFALARVALDDDRAGAEAAVVEAFTDLVTRPDLVDNGSVKHDLAHHVYRICSERAPAGDTTDETGLSRRERTGLGLIVFGDTGCEEAADVIGVPFPTLLTDLLRALDSRT